MNFFKKQDGTLDGHKVVIVLLALAELMAGLIAYSYFNPKFKSEVEVKEKLKDALHESQAREESLTTVNSQLTQENSRLKSTYRKSFYPDGTLKAESGTLDQSENKSEAQTVTVTKAEIQTVYVDRVVEKEVLKTETIIKNGGFGFGPAFAVNLNDPTKPSFGAGGSVDLINVFGLQTQLLGFVEIYKP